MRRRKSELRNSEPVSGDGHRSRLDLLADLPRKSLRKAIEHFREWQRPRPKSKIIDFPLIQNWVVHEGLEKRLFGNFGTSHPLPAVCEPHLSAGSPSVNVLPLGLPLCSNVCSPEWMKLPEIIAASIDTENCNPKTNRVKVSIRGGEVRHSMEVRMPSPVPLDESEAMKGIPIARQSDDVEALSDQDRLSFFSELSATKGFGLSGGSMIALFRRIPIEIITTMKYDTETKTLHYAVSVDRRISHTRLHDVAVIQHSADGQIHILAHRLRYDQVALSA